ncbi:MAG: hypothetical protein P9M14_00525 [Candidatus Alcyoniella australis]|nr:hypothetical protein [Candidatus Alcyoniella australis]
MRKFALILLIALLCAGLAACGGEDDDDGGGSHGDDDDDDDDDTIPPGEEPQLIDSDYSFGPAQCSCPLGSESWSRLRVATFNVNNMNSISVTELVAALDEFELDLLSLQQVPDQATLDLIADGLDMEFALYSEDDAGIGLISDGLLELKQSIALFSGGTALKATTDLLGHTFTVYGFALDSGSAGQKDAQILGESIEDEISPLLIVAGDLGGAEVYSSQLDLLQPMLADAFASLGVYPSQAHTIPAVGWFGENGPHLSDSVLFDRNSGICAADGSALTLSPAGSDHKPAWFELALPTEFGARPPQAMGTLAIFGPTRVEVLFDDLLDPQTLDNVGVDDGKSGNRLKGSAVLIDEGSRLRIDLDRELVVGRRYEIDVRGLLGVNGHAVYVETGLSFVYVENLLSNPGAEQGLAGWNVTGDAREESQRKGITPYCGNMFFAGSPTEARTELSQTLSLDEHAPTIDAGNGLLIFGGVASTAAQLNGNAVVPTARDEAEMLVEVYNESGILMATHSSGKRYTLGWHPILESIELPVGSRRATARLLLYQNGDEGNDAAFDSTFLGFGAIEQDLPRVSPNLLSNSLFLIGEGGQAGWLFKQSQVRENLPEVGGAHDESSYGGQRLVSVGTSLDTGEVSQAIDVEGWADQIDSGELCLEWSGWARSWDGQSRIYPTLTILDQNGEELATLDNSFVLDTQWKPFGDVLRVAPGVRGFEYVIEGMSIAGEPAYFCLPSLHLRRTQIAGVCR